MAHNCNGARFRGANDDATPTVTGRIVCPEIGTTLVCCACFRALPGNADLARHQKSQCNDWNALNRIHCGYYRQHGEGLGPPGLPPCNIVGEHCRLVRDHCNLPAWVIMHQADNWGPCDPIVAPPGLAITSWNGVSCHFLLQGLLNLVPPSIAECPRPDHRTVALRRALANRGTASHTHEIHASDEHADMLAINRFFACNPNAVTDFENDPNNQVPNNDFANTNIFRSDANNHVPLGAPLPRWVPVNPNNEGPARSGRAGVGGAAEAFRLANMNNACVQGRNANQVRNGNFNMVGTPRRL